MNIPKTLYWSIFLCIFFYASFLPFEGRPVKGMMVLFFLGMFHVVVFHLLKEEFRGVCSAVRKIIDDAAEWFNGPHPFVNHALLPAVIFSLPTLWLLSSIESFLWRMIILLSAFFFYTAIIAMTLYILANLGLEARERLYKLIDVGKYEKVQPTYLNMPILMLFGLCFGVIEFAYIIGCILCIIAILIFAGIVTVKKRMFEERVCRSGTSKVLKGI